MWDEFACGQSGVGAHRCIENAAEGAALLPNDSGQVQLQAVETLQAKRSVEPILALA